MISGLTNQIVSLEAFEAEAATGWQGAGSFGDAVDYDARVEWKQRKVVAADGREKLSSGRALIAGDVAVTIRSRLTLPSGSVPSQPPILAIEKNPGLFGEIDVTVIHF